MRQVIVIGGGETHDTYEDYLDLLRHQEFNPNSSSPGGWKSNLQEDLGDGYEVIYPRMPTPNNAKWLEWKAYFHNIDDYANNGAVFVGHSLGGLFLLRYLSVYNLEPKGLLLVATPAQTCGTFEYKHGGGYNLGEVHIFQALDDHIVDPGDAYRIKADIMSAKMHIYNEGGHFYMQTNFPELVKCITQLHKK